MWGHLIKKKHLVPNYLPQMWKNEKARNKELEMMGEGVVDLAGMN